MRGAPRPWNSLLEDVLPDEVSRRGALLAAPIYSVRVDKGYRALGWLEGDTVIWFWIGNHHAYEQLLKGR